MLASESIENLNNDSKGNETEIGRDTALVSCRGQQEQSFSTVDGGGHNHPTSNERLKISLVNSAARGSAKKIVE